MISGLRAQGTKHTAEVRFENSAQHSLPLPPKARRMVLSAKAALLEHYRSVVGSCGSLDSLRGGVQEALAAERRRIRALATVRLVEGAEEEQRREEIQRDAEAEAVEVICAINPRQQYRDITGRQVRNNDARWRNLAADARGSLALSRIFGSRFRVDGL